MMLTKFCVLYILAAVGGGLCQIQLFPGDSSMTGQTRQPSQGEPITLHCILSSTGTDGLVTVTDWTKDSASISTIEQTQPFNTSVTADTLSIPRYSTEYDGYYQCIARLESNNTVILQASPPILLTSYSARGFDEQPMDHIAKINPSTTPPYSYEALAFSCTLSKTFRGPKPIITWQVIEPNGIVNNYTDFNDDSGRDIIIQYDHTGYYQRLNPSMADHGLQVRCIARNSESLDEVVHSNWATANITTEVGSPAEDDLFALVPPEQYHIDPNQTSVILPCVVRDGRQGSQFNLVWYHGTSILYIDGSPLFAASGMSLFGDTNLKLDLTTLSPSYRDPDVSYVCQTRSNNRDVRVSSFLLGPAPATEPPSLTLHTPAIELVESGLDVAQFMYTTPGDTYRTNLWFNGEVVSLGDKYSVEVSASQTVVTIGNVSIADSGQYQLEFITGTILDYSVDVYTFELIVKVKVLMENQLCGYNKSNVVPSVTVPYDCTPSLPSAVQLSTTGTVSVSSDISMADSEARYTCSFGIIKFVLEIEVTALNFNNTMDQIISELGTALTLQCATVDGVTVNQYRWTLDDVFLQVNPGNTLVIDNVTIDSIGRYQCSLVMDQCTVDGSTMQVDVRLPQVKVNSLVDSRVAVAPMMVGGYNCTPSLPYGELSESGDLVTSAGTDVVDGEYQCTSQSLNGFIYFELTVIAKAYVISVSPDLSVSVGTLVTIECIAGGIPSSIQYTWNKDGRFLTTTGSTGSYSFQATTESIGEYECVPSNSEGTHNTSTVLVNIKVTLSVNILDFDDGTIRNTSSLAPPAPSGYDCTPAIPYGRITVSGDLSIVGSPAAGGSYNCTSNDINGTLIIELEEFAPAYVEGFNVVSTMQGNVGSDAVIECPASGIPNDITYTWRKDGLVLDGQNGSSLSITDLTVNDIGEYECIPSNTRGTYNTSRTLLGLRFDNFEVSALDGHNSSLLPPVSDGYICAPPLPNGEITRNGFLILSPGLTASDSREYTCTSADFNNATIVVDLQVYALAYVEVANPIITTVINIGSDSVIECPASGIPNDITYTWRKDGLVLDGQNGSSLNITNLTVNDIGEYECIPSNTRGTYNTSTTIIQGRFENVLVNALNEFNQAMMPPVSNGYVCDPPLPNGEITRDGFLALSPGLTANDSQEYTCTSTDSSITVIVDIEVYAPAYVSVADSNLEGVFNSAITLYCNAKGIPNNFTYVWMKDGHVIPDAVGPSLTIDRMSITDSGRYQCTPYNQYSNYNSSNVQLIVKVVERFDWLTPFTVPGKFPPSVLGYHCLPSLSDRLSIASNGDFISTGLLLEDEYKYICSSDRLQFIFHIFVQGHPPNPVTMNNPVFIDEGRAINVSWNSSISRITPVDEYVLSWTEHIDGHAKETRHGRSRVTTMESWYRFTNFTAEATYYFSVLARNKAGSSEPSPEIAFNIDEILPVVEGSGKKDKGLEVWVIVLIAICGAIVLCICCLCCFCCLLCFVGERQKVYYAEREEIKNAEEFARYRKKGEDENEWSSSSSSDSDGESHDSSSITG